MTSRPLTALVPSLVHLRRHIRHRRVVAALVFSVTQTGCVSASRFDQAVAEGEAARIGRDRARAELQTKDKEIARGAAERERLHRKLERRADVTSALLLERGDLAMALGASAEELYQARRALAAAEHRALVYREIAAKLAHMVDAGDLEVSLRDGRMVLQLPDDILFDPGRAIVKDDGVEVLRDVATALKSVKDRHFIVAGHTDDRPIETPRFRSNWELSAARGVEVVRILVAEGVAPTALVAAGHASFDPVAPNDSEEGRRRNRRVEITVQPNVEEIVPERDGGDEVVAEGR